MAEEKFKERICREMIGAAKMYKERYVDYEYLICSEAFVQNAYYIIDAKEDNFQHLTGIHSQIKPKDFFDKCYQGTLTADDFDFNKKGQNEKSVKGTVRRKVKTLPNMMELFTQGLQAEENFIKNKVECSFAAADGSCTLGFTENEKARPRSLIKGNELSEPKPVDLILRKRVGEAQFDELVIGDKETLQRYKGKIEGLFDEKLL